MKRLVLSSLLAMAAMNASAEIVFHKILPWSDSAVSIGAAGGAPSGPLTPDEVAAAESAWDQWISDNSYTKSNGFLAISNNFRSTTAFPPEPYPVTTAQSLNFAYSAVTDISSLSRLTSVDYLSLDTGCCGNGPGVSSIAALSNLSGTVGTLVLSRNSVTDLSPLGQITEFAWLDLYSNNLTSLNGLSSLSHIDKKLLLQFNDIVDFTALSGVTFGLGVEVKLQGNPATNVNGLEGVATASDISFYNMPNLTNVDGMSGLINVSNNLSFGQNPALQNVEGLRNLEVVGGSLDLRVGGPYRALDISGLRSLNSVGSLLLPDLYIGHPDSVLIPASAPACQPENSGWFTGTASQAEACEAPAT